MTLGLVVWGNLLVSGEMFPALLAWKRSSPQRALRAVQKGFWRVPVCNLGSQRKRNCGAQEAVSEGVFHIQASEPG